MSMQNIQGLESDAHHGVGGLEAMLIQTGSAMQVTDHSRKNAAEVSRHGEEEAEVLFTHVGLLAEQSSQEQKPSPH